MNIQYLSVEDAIAIHDGQIELFGGGSGIRDAGQLASAMFRPQSGYYADVIEQAAALWESLGQNHPFIDGNRRTSLVVTDVFLQLNGYYINIADEDLWKIIIKWIENKSFDFNTLDSFLRNNTSTL